MLETMLMSAAGAGVLAAIICAYAEPLAYALKIVDRPDGIRKLHQKPTPLVGGLATVIPTVLVAMVMGALGVVSAAILGVLLLTMIGFLVGFVDDRQDLHPFWRLAFCAAPLILISALFPDLLLRTAWFGDEAVLTLPALGALAFTAVALIGFVNAINMMDGANGLVIGSVLGWSVLLAAVAPQGIAIILMALSVGAAITLIFNLKGKLFLGDSGTYGIGFALGLISIQIYNWGGPLGRVNAEFFLALFAVPVLDCSRLIISRKINGYSPFTADRRHLHHILQQLFPLSLLQPVYWILTVAPGALALLLPGYEIIAALSVSLVYLGLILWPRSITRKQSEQTSLFTPSER